MVRYNFSLIKLTRQKEHGTALFHIVKDNKFSKGQFGNIFQQSLKYA